MPEDEELMDDTPVTGVPAGGIGKKKMVTAFVVAGLMLLEGGALYWAINRFAGPPPVSLAGEVEGEGDGTLGLADDVEIELPELNAFNKKEGRLYLYHMKITIRVKKDAADKVGKALERRESTIQDRFNTVIRSADLNYLNEPGLDTIRRQFRFELDKILGDDQLILELLIPKFFQSPADV